MTPYALLLVISLVAGTLAAPTNTTVAEQDNVCGSCKKIESFTKRMVSTNGYEETKENLINWCIDTKKGANLKVCSFLVKDVITALDRVASEYFCERIKACADSSPYDFMTNTDNTSCDFCVNTMTHIRAIATDPQTEAEFKLAIGQACTKLGSFRDECVQLADENLDNLFIYLKKMLDPQQVCEQTGYCIKDFEATRPKEFVGDIAGVINIGPVVMPPEQPEEVSEEVIPFLDIERTATGVLLTSEELSGSKLNCMICKQAAAWLIEKLKDNKTEEAIVQALDEVCDTVFPKNERPQCETFVKQYADEVIAVLKTESNPNLICELIGVCSSTKEVNQVPKTDANVETEDGIVCEYCLKASDWLNKQLADNRTEASIVAALNQVCSIAVPAEKREDCEEYIREKVDEIVECLVNGTDPKAICSTLKLCPPSVGGMTVVEGDIIIEDTSVERELVEPAESTLFPSCFICKRIAGWINGEIEGNRTDAAIKSALDRVCSVFFPKRDRVKCQAEVDDWSGRIATTLKDVTDPEIACGILMVCSDMSKGVERNEAPETAVESNLNEVEEANAPPKSDEACFECQSVAHFIQTELYDYNKEKVIDDWVIKNICDKVTTGIARQTCESFINEYGSSILHLIAMQAFDPKVLCEKELKLCPATLVEIGTDAPEPSDNPKLEFELVKPSKAEMCDICIQSVKQLDTLLTTGIVDHEISHVATKACNYLDAKKRQMCVTVIETYGPYFLQMIGRLNNARQVCKAVDMCYITGEVHLLGGHKCTFGPTYWCHTSAHAESCKATDFCKRKVWTAVE